LEKRQAESERKEEEVTRLLKIRADRERAKEAKQLEKEAKEQQGVLRQSGRTKQLPITGFTIAQGMRTLTDYLEPPAPVADQPDLPFGRPRPEFDPNEPTPFYRSTKDRLETPVLRDILEGGGADSTFTSEDLGVQPEELPQEELPQEEVPQEELPQEEVSMTDDNLLGMSEGMAESPDVNVTPPNITPPKRKGGRPVGSKNKPKPPPSDPSQVAMIGSSALVGRSPKGKTPANTPAGSMN
jgi:hypothetical protein